MEQTRFDEIVQDTLNLFAYFLNYNLPNFEQDVNFYDQVADLQFYSPEVKPNLRLGVKTVKNSGSTFGLIRVFLPRLSNLMGRCSF